MSGHCFISYSTADALDFTRRLADELESSELQIFAWYDKRDLRAGEDWDEQIVEAIKSCKCMLFVMTDDSTKAGSDYKNEILFALRYKKPILPILLHQTAEPVFALSNREWIDFTGGFKAGMPKLRKYIRELELPKGIIRTLNERLTDAEHDLRRAKGEETDRIKAEIEELKRQIEAQQKIVDDPQAAADQTQKNIEAGLERERQPVKTIAAQTSTKFVNPPPGIAPYYFQNRFVETEQIARFLQDTSQYMMTVVGRGGVGKTAMVCRLLKGLEGGELPDGLGRMRVEGIVYLSESGSHRVNFANLFYDLCKLLPAEAANALDAVYKNPQASTASKMSALLDRFTAGKVVVLLDNVEPLISVETFDIADAELDECLRALLHGAHSALKVILTTRVAPRGLNLSEPGRQRVLTLDSGLEPKYAVEMLREMDVDGKLGLKAGTDELLGRACERTLGFPRALEALFAILASDRYTTLDELLAMPTPVNLVEALVGEAFNRLDTNAQKVMQALAVYNRPVTPAAVDYLLAPHIPAMDSAPILQRLANMHFARKERGLFYLHPVDREFAFSLIPATITDQINNKATEEEKEKGLASKELEVLLARIQKTTPNPKRYMGFDTLQLQKRAADYFTQIRKPRAEWKRLEDLSAQLAEFELRYAAGDYDAAADVLTDIDFDYLLLWGHYRLVIDMHRKLQGKIKNSILARISVGNLGQALSFIGEISEAVINYKKALTLSQEIKDRDSESVWLSNLGNGYAVLGEIDKAIECYEKALIITNETRSRRNESIFGNLGLVYADAGYSLKAIELYKQALIISREIGNRREEGNQLDNLGNAYLTLGDTSQAIEYYTQALSISREIGDRRREGLILGGYGNAYVSIGDIHQAIEFYAKALLVVREIDDKYSEILTLSRLGLANLLIGRSKDALENFENAKTVANQINALEKVRLIDRAIDDATKISRHPEDINKIQVDIKSVVDQLGVSRTANMGERK